MARSEDAKSFERLRGRAGQRRNERACKSVDGRNLARRVLPQALRWKPLYSRV
jgi:hypothetical protein